MGWAGGSEVGDSIWLNIRHLIKEEDREEAARVIINALEAEDCDTVYECEQLVIDAGLESEYFPEDEDE